MHIKLRRLIQPECELAKLQDQALKDGMQPLRLSGAQKVHAGLTTLEEVIRTLS